MGTLFIAFVYVIINCSRKKNFIAQISNIMTNMFLLNHTLNKRMTIKSDSPSTALVGKKTNKQNK